ncbi:MAG TPA: amidohydrolase family protein, partial [Thermoanaerobaculia bacterium]|nr:amidohydrolase family protein [Thermoanaerobaculia bacterium]
LAALLPAPFRAAEVRPIAIRAARLLDVRRGVIVPDPVVVVEGDRIRSVGREVPAGAEVLDLGPVTLVPGLFDMHTHLSVGGTAKMRGVSLMTATPADVTIQAAVNARETLLAGFTSVRECGANDFIDVALKNAVARGAIPGPRITPSGYQISMTGGHGDVVGFPPGVFELGPKEGIADGVPNVLFAVRYQLKHGAEVIKVMATGGVLGEERTPTARQYSDEELRAVVEEAHRNGVKVEAHAHGLEGILAAIRAGVDSIEHGSMLNEEGIRLMKERGTFLVPTLYVAQPASNTGAGMSEHVREKGKQMGAEANANFPKAVRAGVRIAFGTDAGVYPHGLNAREFGVLVEHGMTPIDAIRSATIWAADLLGVSDRGSIEPGYVADIVAAAGDPLQNVRTLESVAFVMKGGVVYRNEAAPR